MRHRVAGQPVQLTASRQTDRVSIPAINESWYQGLLLGLLLCTTRSFSRCSGHDHHKYSLRLSTRGWPGRVGLGCWLYSEMG